jgi:hypothetical protein
VLVPKDRRVRAVVAHRQGVNPGDSEEGRDHQTTEDMRPHSVHGLTVWDEPLPVNDEATLSRQGLACPDD